MEKTRMVVRADDGEESEGHVSREVCSVVRTK
jgi:hypothetical protein